MYPRGYWRDLDELQEQAGILFTALRERFPSSDGVRFRFDRIDSLVGTEIEQHHVVTTALLCAQLLHREIAVLKPEPRPIVTLCDILDQALTNLTGDSEQDVPMEIVGAAHKRICDLSMNLAMKAAPGAPGFDDEWPEPPHGLS